MSILLTILVPTALALRRAVKKTDVATPSCSPALTIVIEPHIVVVFGPMVRAAAFACGYKNKLMEL
jgi:hypothetical protein